MIKKIGNYNILDISLTRTDRGSFYALRFQLDDGRGYSIKMNKFALWGRWKEYLIIGKYRGEIEKYLATSFRKEIDLLLAMDPPTLTMEIYEYNIQRGRYRSINGKGYVLYNNAWCLITSIRYKVLPWKPEMDDQGYFFENEHLYRILITFKSGKKKVEFDLEVIGGEYILSYPYVTKRGFNELQEINYNDIFQEISRFIFWIAKGKLDA